MTGKRLPFRDPRTVARDIPGVLDVLFPRLSGALVASLNRRAFTFDGLAPIADELVEQSELQKAMLFELAMAQAERLLAGELLPDWDACLRVAAERQSRHYDARIPKEVSEVDKRIAGQAAENLVAMLSRIRAQNPTAELDISPNIPGMGWIASGSADFAIGHILIEVKHTDRNFISGDLRQILMYWLLAYSAALQRDTNVWSDCILLNPRRNSALHINFNRLIRSASANSTQVELYELLRSIVGNELVRG